MSWSSFLLLAAMVTSPADPECSAVRAAHEAALAGSFTAVREFTLVINGEVKALQTSRVSYANGTVEREVLSQELRDKNLVLDEDEVLSALALPFDCSLLTSSPDGHFELVSAKGTEKVVFELHDTEEALRPVTWANNETVRFLWKRLEIEAVAVYRNFEWR